MFVYSYGCISQMATDASNLDGITRATIGLKRSVDVIEYIGLVCMMTWTTSSIACQSEVEADDECMSLEKNEALIQGQQTQLPFLPAVNEMLDSSANSVRQGATRMCGDGDFGHVPPDLVDHGRILLRTLGRSMRIVPLVLALFAGHSRLLFPALLLDFVPAVQGQAPAPPVPPPYTPGDSLGVAGWETSGLPTGWSNGVSAHSWRRRSGTTPTSSTGPSSVKGGSFYMYTEMSSPVTSGDTFDLNYACLQGDWAEVSWWYHMNGATMGSLRRLKSTLGSTVWTKSGDQGQTWGSASASVPTAGFTFEGKRGTSFTGDMALDDVSIACICSPSPPTTPPKAPPAPPAPSAPPSAPPASSSAAAAPPPPLSPGWAIIHDAEELKDAFENHTAQDSPSCFLLQARARFFLGNIWPMDGLALSGGSATIVGAGEGATLDTEGRSRFFYATAGNLTVRNVQLVNGSAQVRPLVPLLVFATQAGGAHFVTQARTPRSNTPPWMAHTHTMHHIAHVGWLVCVVRRLGAWWSL